VASTVVFIAKSHRGSFRISSFILGMVRKLIVECDEEPIKGVFDLMGVANIVFSTDFPHPDSKYPRAVARFLELPLPDAAKRAILRDNCARCYGLT
jgi:predicted TIM-barrel fold metal-dependent hydrolase